MRKNEPCNEAELKRRLRRVDQELELRAVRKRHVQARVRTSILNSVAMAIREALGVQS